MSLYQQMLESGLIPQPGTRCLFVLMEAATQQELLARMTFHDTVHRCLWRGDAIHGMEFRAPWLAQVEPGSAFDTWTGASMPALSATLITASLPFDALWRHLRRFAKFEADGRKYFLRLGDAASLRLYTASLADQPDAVTRFFAQGDIRHYYFHDPRVGLACSVHPVFEIGTPDDAREGCLVWRDATLEAS